MIIDTPHSRICDRCRPCAAVANASFAPANKKTRAPSVKNAILNQLSAAELANTVLLIRQFRSGHSTHQDVAGSALCEAWFCEQYLKEAAAPCARNPRRDVFLKASGWRVPHTECVKI